MRTWAILIVAVAGVGGCTARGPYTPMEEAGGGPAHQTTHGVTEMDENVRNAFLLRSNNATLTPGGQIQARVTLQNVYESEVFVDVRFVFFNANDEPVDVGMWRTVHFPPRDMVMIEGNSIKVGLAKYNLQMRNLATPSGRRLSTPGRVYENGLWKRSALPQ